MTKNGITTLTLLIEADECDTAAVWRPSAIVTAMQRAGIIQGDGACHFDPTGTTTRAAASKIICMLMQHLYK